MRLRWIQLSAIICKLRSVTCTSADCKANRPWFSKHVVHCISMHDHISMSCTVCFYKKHSKSETEQNLLNNEAKRSGFTKVGEKKDTVELFNKETDKIIGNPGGHDTSQHTERVKFPREKQSSARGGNTKRQSTASIGPPKRLRLVQILGSVGLGVGNGVDTSSKI